MSLIVKQNEPINGVEFNGRHQFLQHSKSNFKFLLRGVLIFYIDLTAYILNKIVFRRGFLWKIKKKTHVEKHIK